MMSVIEFDEILGHVRNKTRENLKRLNEFFTVVGDDFIDLSTLIEQGKVLIDTRVHLLTDIKHLFTINPNFKYLH